MKRVLSILLLLTLAITSVFAVSYFLSEPKITSLTPSEGSYDIDPKISLAIQFDKPINRRKLEKFISPDTPGKWVFEEPLVAPHLYRRLVFYPDVGLKPDTNYSIQLKGVKNTLGTSKSKDYQFSFKTKADPVVSKAIKELETQTTKLSVPAYLQQHTLSCEVSALKMTLAYKGVTKSEEELLAQVGVDNTPHIGNTWGNPYEGFVGDVNGTQMRTGYGVYWGPIERVAKNYGEARAFENGSIETLTKEVLAGNPIIIWVYSRNGTPTFWKTPSGQEIFAVAGEHTVVVVGFVGSAANPTQLIINDPLTGQVYWSRSFFDKKWSTFNESGVVIYK